jgi:SAM-dependent methyltransferase
MAALREPAARYDAWAQWYESYVAADRQGFTGRTGRVLAQILGRGTGPLLDLACGTGIFAPRLRDLGWTPAGLDLSPAQLGYARGRLPVAVADAARLPVRTGSMAAVTAVLCHTDNDDYAAACRAVRRVLRPGGVFAHVGVHPCFIGAFADRSDPEQVLVKPGYWQRERSFEAWSPHGVRARVGATHLPVSELLNALTGAGLTIERVLEDGGPVPDILAVRCRRGA